MGFISALNFGFSNYAYTPSFIPSFGGFNSYAPLFSFGGTSTGSSYGLSGLSFAPKSNSYDFSFLNTSAGSRAKSSTRSNLSFGSLTRRTGNLQLDLVNNAMSWVGKVNNDATGNRLFSGGVSQHWCADFVTWNTRKTFGSKLPSSFGSSSVAGLRDWGESNNCYIDTTAVSNKSDFIAQNVKPGDIMIEKRGGKSHTGIVTKVNSDGSFETVEGNTSNKVGTRKYSANSSTLSGFVSLDKYAVA